MGRPSFPTGSHAGDPGAVAPTGGQAFWRGAWCRRASYVAAVEEDGRLGRPCHSTDIRVGIDLLYDSTAYAACCTASPRSARARSSPTSWRPRVSDDDSTLWTRLVDVLAHVRHAAVLLSGYPCEEADRWLADGAAGDEAHGCVARR